ncbi:MAG: hypothetical protein JW802_03835 [Campylobacterales bacterium]|nr:hypothetical protein [Campylobacterales bacterium]NCD12529.1 hypothetical protein [Campylobacterota bacterium]
MYIDGDVLELDIEMDLEEVKSLKTFVQDRLNYIEEIVLLHGKDGVPTTSALFALLFWVKRQKPSIKIDFFETMNLELESFGTMYWIAHE